MQLISEQLAFAVFNWNGALFGESPNHGPRATAGEDDVKAWDFMVLG